MRQDELYTEIQYARSRIQKYIKKTPLEKFDTDANGYGIYFKLENDQHTGSFKLRGALNKLLSLSDSDKEQGIIAASTGNHALATAYALKLTNGKGTIYLPNQVAETKLEKLRKYNVELVHFGDDSADTEVEARRISDQEHKPFISPYNDYTVIAGQGTIGMEIFDDLKSVQNVFVTVGGGGLISGIGTYLKQVLPAIKIFGSQPENSAVMFESIKKGEIIEMESLPTISDGSAGGIEEGSVTFEIVRTVVDDFILVTEDEIKQALKEIYEKTNLVVEGAAAVALASYNKVSDIIEGDSVIIICGGNIDNELFQSIVSI